MQAQLLVPAGTADEPDSLPGLAELTSRIVQAGSASRTREQLAADLGAAGATLAISAQRDYALAACGARSSSFDAALEIMADVVVSPRLEEEPFQSAQGAMIARLRSRARSEAALADDRMWGIALDPHPYGHPEGGVFDGLLETHLEDVKNFVRDRWRPDRAVLAIAGDVTPEHAFAAAQDVFGRWAGKVAADRARPAPAPQAGVRLMDLPGSPRAEVRVLVRGPGRAAPELAAWQVARAALEDRLAGSGASVALTRCATPVCSSSPTKVRPTRRARSRAACSERCAASRPRRPPARRRRRCNTASRSPCRSSSKRSGRGSAAGRRTTSRG